LVRPNYNRGIAKTEGIKLTQNNKWLWQPTERNEREE